MSNIFLVVDTIFGGAWKLFQTNVPGFSFSYADIVLAFLLAGGAIFILRLILGLGSSGSQGLSSNGRSAQNPKISQERKDDQK